MPLNYLLPELPHIVGEERAIDDEGLRGCGGREGCDEQLEYAGRVHIELREDRESRPRDIARCVGRPSRVPFDARPQDPERLR